MTAPPPRLTIRLDAKWSHISKAVATGLDVKKADKSSPIAQLANVLIVDDTEVPLESGQRSEYEISLTRDELDSVTEHEISDWARESREMHLMKVLNALAARAPDETVDYTDDGIRGINEQIVGTGGFRLIHLRGDRKVADNLLKHGLVVEIVDVSATVNNRDGDFATTYPELTQHSALVMREYGAPYLNRPKDLTLGWEPIDTNTVRLVLETTWQLKRAETTDGRASVLALFAQ